jgi:chemotaxis protein CheX
MHVIEAFVAATATAFQELTNTEVAAREQFIVNRLLALDVTATIVLRREPPGLLSLSFPLPVLEKLAGCYLGGIESLTAELIDDAAGEFANVIAGQAKTMLKGTPEHFWLSTPIVQRTGTPGQRVAGSAILTLYFDCNAGSFALQVVHG